jgi:hypothetical protein
MNIYDIADTLAVALRDNAALKSHCITKWGQGALIQIDENAEKPELGSKNTPWINLTALPGSLAGVGDRDTHVLAIGVGISGKRASSPVDAPWTPVVTTTRSATANGLQKIGVGNDAADLLELVLTICGASALPAGCKFETTSFDVNGFSYYPLQVAAAVVQISRVNTLNEDEFA